MKLSKPVKILVAVGTAWVVLYPLLFLLVWMSMMLGTFLPVGADEARLFFFAPFFLIFPLMVVSVPIQLAMQVFYLAHVIKNTAVSETIRIILGTGVFFMPFIAMPIYYYLFIWLDQPPAWALAGEPEQSQPPTGKD